MGYNPKDKNFYFDNFMEFGFFTRVNARNLTQPDDPPELAQEIYAVKAQLEQMTKAMQSTTGGCGCTMQKRREFAVTKMKEAIEALSESSTAVARLKARNQNPEKFIFRLTGGSDEIFMEL